MATRVALRYIIALYEKHFDMDTASDQLKNDYVCDSAVMFMPVVLTVML